MSHYYTHAGEPRHFMPNEAARKRGEANAQRETTIRDARKLNLNPSVTTITKIVDKGDLLLEWTIKQALYSAATHPDGWPRFQLVDGVLLEKDPDFVRWAERCRADAKQQVAVKAERGSILHDMMMRAHHAYDSIEPQYLAHVDGMFAKLRELFGQRKWIAEHSFAHPLGFGGSVDLHTDADDDCPLDSPQQIILDYKFKDFDDSRDASYFVYDEHRMQLGGYRIGLRRPKARCFNAFGSISDPGLVLIHEHSEADIKHGEEMFLAANALFQAKHKYRPRWD